MFHRVAYTLDKKNGKRKSKKGKRKGKAEKQRKTDWREKGRPCERVRVEKMPSADARVLSDKLVEWMDQ